MLICLGLSHTVSSQLKWANVDHLYQPLPKSVHVYYSNDSIDGKPNIAYYVEAELKDRSLDFTTQVANGKRHTPAQYYTIENNPLVVVNTTFFEFVHNSNLNLVVKNGKVLAYNNHSIAGRGKDTFTYRHPFASALGISKSRNADIAWTYADTSQKFIYATQVPLPAFKDSSKTLSYKNAVTMTMVAGRSATTPKLFKWRMNTAVGGGPVLVQNGQVKITNNEEMKFGGKAINDKHPRTTMGYTADGKLIILVIQGRFPGIAEGASLEQEAKILAQLGCIEAMNLDGGGSSCLLINGKETIKPSDKEGQRPVPAVFMIKQRN
jgi:hypothetical protein